MNKTLRVLIVEDSEDDTLLLIQEIRRNGYEPRFERVDTREAMKEALDKQTWDIVLADYSMPGFSGADALKLLKERDPDIPFILASGKIGEETAVEMMKAGAHDYIMKNNLSRLVPAIERELKEAVIRRKSRLAEQEFRKNEEKYRLIVQNIDETIYAVDISADLFEGNLTFVSSQIENITGYRPDEFLNNPRLWFQNIHPDDVHSVIEDTRRIAERKKKGTRFYRILNKTMNEYRWLEDRVSPQINENGDVEGFFGVARDITDRKHLESQLMHFNRVEAIARLSGGIAHEFNNIFTGLIGYGNIMKLKMKNDDPLNNEVEKILTLTNQASTFTHGLLTFSREQAVNLKPVNLNGIISRVSKIIVIITGKDIEHETELTDEKMTVIADSGQIEQVLINLASNSRDAMPHGGLLKIKTELVKINSNYIKHYGYGKPGTYALISVSDNGTGIDEETISRIFEPFFTTKGTAKSTGLGLSIVYGIIKQHKGYLNVHSVPGKGTTFEIYLPIVKSLADENEITLPYSPTGAKETILVAEDEATVREITKNLLEEFGYRVIEAVDGKDATEKFMKNRDRVKLMLLDVIMPKKNGKEVYDEISRIKPDIKALFISGFTADALKQKGIFESEPDLILKPISPQELLKKVKEVLVA